MLPGKGQNLLYRGIYILFTLVYTVSTFRNVLNF